MELNLSQRKILRDISLKSYNNCYSNPNNLYNRRCEGKIVNKDELFETKAGKSPKKVDSNIYSKMASINKLSNKSRNELYPQFLNKGSTIPRFLTSVDYEKWIFDIHVL